MSNENLTLEECYEDPAIADGIRVFLVAVVGSMLCSVGVVFNGVLLIVFSKMPCTRNHLLYMVCLCWFDILVEISYMQLSVCYAIVHSEKHKMQLRISATSNGEHFEETLLLFTVSVLYDYYRFYTLYKLWHEYARVVSTVAQVLIPASVYTIIAASAERYVSSKERKINHFDAWQRVIIIFFTLLFAVCIKGSVFFEIMVTRVPECGGFEEYHLSQSTITSSWLYSTIWMFWARNIFTVFLPFTLLFFLNWATRRNMSLECADLLINDRLHENIKRRPSLDHILFQRRRKREATRTLVCIVSTYLITNTPNLLITIWEHIHIDSLRSIADGTIYASDISSLLTIGCTALRLPIYYSCNREIRHGLRRFLPASSSDGRRKK
ncbi:hypothetical protein Tcan_08156 [Toxocara canis]|uniref:G-protein coupled receptors family 1 profile domain-containing protein n=1 Tax=Toxocara canis TaxID=6265 RepID=A0A0B2VW67_TOXCA|nr:hypothetical protein Tcan_08156 [Toxocara canis]